MSLFPDIHKEFLQDLYEKELDELEKVRSSEVYQSADPYNQGIIDGAIIQIIKLKEKINW